MRLRAAALLPLALLAGCKALPSARSPERGPERVPGGPIARPALSPQAGKCLAQLGGAGARFTPQPDAFYGAGCGTVNAVRLEGLSADAGTIAVTNLGAVACPLADTFAGWARFGVDRAARQILGSELIRIETMGSYACRNVVGSAASAGRRSAHARAEAIDVAAFVLGDGRRIAVLADWSGGDAAEREFLRVVHRSACKRFGTVLGPDYNAAHRDHFHLEQGDGSFCR